jgi:hypothetical protein
MSDRFDHPENFIFLSPDEKKAWDEIKAKNEEKFEHLEKSLTPNGEVRVLKRYGPRIGGLALCALIAGAVGVVSKQFTVEQFLEPWKTYRINQTFVVDDPKAELEAVAKADGFSPLNLDNDTSRPHSRAIFDQEIGSCALPFQMHVRKVSSAQAVDQSPASYTLILNQELSDYVFADFTDMRRRLQPDPCESVSQLADAAE